MSSTTQTRIRTRDLDVGRHRFRLHESGDPSAPSVLFLHGAGPGATALSNWERVIDDLSDRFHCLAPDMIGFGDSSHPVDPPRGMGPFNDLRAQALLELLQVLGLERVHVVGNSMGGMLAILMVLARPHHIGRIVLMGSGGAPDMPVSPGLADLRTFYADPSEERLKQLMVQFVHDPVPFDGVADQIARERMAYVQREDVSRSHAAAFHPDGPRRTFDPEELAGIDHPTLVLHGRQDRIIPLEASLYFADHLPNADLFVLGRCGHWTQIEQRRAFETLLTRFVEGDL